MDFILSGLFLQDNIQMLMIPTKCAICETLDNAKVLFNERLPPEGINPHVYAPRRKRDYVHYRFVKCNSCGLVRSDPIIDPHKLSELYQRSECTYTDKNENIPLKKTYGNYIKQLLDEYNVEKETYLDIGCSNGFMLETALELGFRNVVGVEPSKDAINRANKAIQNRIINKMFHGELFESEKFNLISFFQTFDHISDPNGFLKECYKLLKKDGFIIAIHHNIGSFSYRILKERSPLIDIGHAYLYDFNTIKKIFEKNQFTVLKIFSVKNIVSIGRFLELLPIRESIKNITRQFITDLKISGVSVPMYLGNLGIIAQKS